MPGSPPRPWGSPCRSPRSPPSGRRPTCRGDGYWLGTPASLNFSLPALALRATDPELAAGAPPPLSWQTGNNLDYLDLSPARRRLSVGVSLAALALGLAAIGTAAARARRAEGGSRGPWILAALASLAVLASPVSWFHYQIFALPGLALLAAAALRRRSGLALAGVAALATGLTRAEVREAVWGPGTAERVLAAGAVVVACNILLIAWLVAEIGRSTHGEGGFAHWKATRRRWIGRRACRQGFSKLRTPR